MEPQAIGLIIKCSQVANFTGDGQPAGRSDTTWMVLPPFVYLQAISQGGYVAQDDVTHRFVHAEGKITQR